MTASIDGGVHDVPTTAASPWPYPVISADSHITEPPNAYIDFIDPAYRDRAPKMVDGGAGIGDVFVIDGMAAVGAVA